MKKARVWIKRILSRITCLIEFCHDCGVEQPVVWTASNPLWASIMEQTLENEMPGITCPICFNKRAEAKGILLMWTSSIISSKSKEE